MKKSIKKNFIMNALLTMSSFIFPLVTFPYISRILQPQGLGKVSLALSFVSYFAMFAQLGIPTYGIRACAKVRDNKNDLSQTVHELFAINSITSIVSIGVFIMTVCYLPQVRQEKLLYCIVGSSIIFNLIGMEWLYKALEEYSYITARSLIFKSIAVISMFLLVKRQSDYLWYAGITIFATSASNLCNFYNLRKLIYWRHNKLELKKHLKPVLVFFAMSCATTIYTNLDTVMLGFMSSETDVGLYNAAVKIKVVLVSLVTSLGAVLLPRSSYYVENGHIEQFKMVTEKAMRFVFLLALPLSAYFMLYSKECIIFLSGETYMDATIPMMIIMPTLLLIGISNVTGIQVLLPIGKETSVLISEVSGAVIDLLLNLMLIPKFQAAGAAIGTLVAETMVVAIQGRIVHKSKMLTFSLQDVVKIVAAVVVAIIVPMLLKSLELNVFVKLLSSAISFFSVYGLILLLLKDPIIGEIMLLIKKVRK